MSNPKIPAPGIRKTGSALYFIARIKKRHNNNPVLNDISPWAIMVKAAAAIIPITAGLNPLNTAKIIVEFLILSK